MTSEESKTLHVIDALEAEGIAYFLSGSFASNLYGVPRSTKDADIVLEAINGVGPSFARRLGSEYALDPQLSFETMTGTFRQYVRHQDSSFKIELFVLSDDPHDQQRFARCRAVKLFDRTIWFPSAEDVIVSKVRWARRKDEEDVFNVMCVQRGQLDWAYIETWCEKHRTTARMDRLRRAVPRS